MYDDLSMAAMAVVQRAYDAQEGKYPHQDRVKYPEDMSYYRYVVGEYTRERAVTTATWRSP